MNDKVKEQLLAVRDTDEVNIFNIPKVREIALREGYTELYEYLLDFD